SLQSTRPSESDRVRRRHRTRAAATTPSMITPIPIAPSRKTGGERSSVTVIVTKARLPDVSVARATMVFDPSRKVRSADQDVVPVATDHILPSRDSSTRATAVSSAAVPVTVTDADRRIAPFRGDAIATLGRVVSGPTGVADSSVDCGPSPAALAALT